MRRMIYVFILVIFLISLTCLSSCNDIKYVNGYTSSNINNLNSNSSDTSAEIIPDISPEKNEEYFFLTEQSSKNIISIKVPVLEIENKAKINNIIYQHIISQIEDIGVYDTNLSISESDIPNKNITTDYTGYYIDIDYKIALKSENLISIVFEGYLNYKTAAHPNHIFFTLNIDPKTTKIVYFSDTYLISTELYQSFMKYAREKFSDSNISISADNVFNETSFLEGMENEYQVEYGFYCYYTESHIGISYPVPFALGNHFEVEIPIEDIDVK